ncbi:TonB-dependent receptor [Pseudovibrio exalbescens]|uniref:TonB-dependent receptor domain-containing protein n=1 Tax=Pseudovibrio exalbescens TaxID=197461 RepID=UPI002365557B|nr:TonB-dependent receptor [Pseudovibrio exalbescens]MDD7909566.1 TonB-dependent receptor [Pseudovibrio exalbescens]
MFNGTVSRAALLAGTTLSLALPLAGAQAQEATTVLDEIVVSAGEEKIAIDTPQAVTVVTQEQIEASQAATLGEILDAIPGVTTINADNPLGQSLNMRGIGGALSSDENRMIMQVDGVRSFFEAYRSGSFFFEPEMFKQVEVLRGPASSTLYGSGALAGTVSARTKDASDFLEGDDTVAVRAKTTWDSNGNGSRNSIIAAMKPLEDIEFLANFNYGRYGNYDAAKGKELGNSLFTDLSGLAKLKYTFGTDRDQSLTASYFNINKSGNGLYDQITYEPMFGYADQEISEQQGRLTYENAFAGNDLLDLTAQLAYSETKRELDDITYRNPWDGQPAFGLEAEYVYKTWQGKLQNTSQIEFSDSALAFLTFGVQGHYRERLNPRLNPDGSTSHGASSHPEGESRMIGAYGQAEVILFDRLTLIPGMRVDYSRLSPGEGVSLRDDVSDTAFSPKLAAIYELTPWLNVFGSVSHTERMPVIDEAFTGGGFTDLGKEKSNNFEAGFGFKFDNVLQDDDGVRLKVTGFHNDVENYLYTTFDHMAGGAITTAIEDVRIQGVEVEAGYASPTWYGSFGAALTRGDNLSDDTYLETVAADNAFISVGYRFEDYNLDVSWRSNFYARQDRVNNAGSETGGYALHGASLSWLPEEGWMAGAEVRASVTNIFDKAYTPHLSGTEGKGRSFKLSVAKTF